MANINDYLNWRGDLKINKSHPFNTLDAMVLARVSYLPFHKIDFDSTETIHTVCVKMLTTLSEKDYAWVDDFLLVKNLVDCSRFKNMRLSDYVRNNNRALEKQFSAITVHLNRREMFLSFFGTDDTIVGWKEDFNLCFLDSIPAQEEGKKYLVRAMRKFPWKKLILGGHSKGGNVAIYSAVTAPDLLQSRISAVYNFDGPGLRKDTAALDRGQTRVVPRILSVIPQGSVIGRLFEHVEKVLVVESDAKGLYQHDLYSWQVFRDKLVPSETTKASDFGDKMITSWVESASEEERRIFIEGMFKIFESAKVETPIQLMTGWYKYAPTLIKAYRNTPEEQKLVILEVWKKLGESFMKTRKG